MPDEPRRYLSFLVRLWPAHTGEHLIWRASLEDAHTGIRHGFKDLAAAMAFLDAQIKELEWEQGVGSTALPTSERTNEP